HLIYGSSQKHFQGAGALFLAHEAHRQSRNQERLHHYREKIEEIGADDRLKVLTARIGEVADEQVERSPRAQQLTDENKEPHRRKEVASQFAPRQYDDGPIDADAQSNDDV